MYEPRTTPPESEESNRDVNKKHLFIVSANATAKGMMQVGLGRCTSELNLRALSGS